MSNYFQNRAAAAEYERMEIELCAAVCDAFWDEASTPPLRRPARTITTPAHNQDQEEVNEWRTRAEEAARRAQELAEEIARLKGKRKEAPEEEEEKTTKDTAPPDYKRRRLGASTTPETPTLSTPTTSAPTPSAAMPPVRYLISGGVADEENETSSTAHPDVVKKGHELYAYCNAQKRHPPGAWYQTPRKMSCIDSRLRKVGSRLDNPESPTTACDRCVEERRPCVVSRAGIEPTVLPLPCKLRTRGKDTTQHEAGYYIVEERVARGIPEGSSSRPT